MSTPVWITGAGVVSAAGIGAPALLELLRSGCSGVCADPGLDGMQAGVAETPPPMRDCRHLDRAAAMFVAAGAEAWDNAGLAAGALDPDRLAVIEGSSLGPMADLLHEFADRLVGDSARPDHDGRRRLPRPSLLVKLMTGAGGAVLAQRLAAHGAVLHVSAGSVSATCAIGEAFERVASGRADVVVAGGAECPLHPEILALFQSAGVAAIGPGAACRPFDASRTGTVLGEGAGALVLEAEAHARARGATARAVVSGFALTCEAGSIVAPEPTGAGIATVTRRAIGADLGRIGWIKAHGTGTRTGDAAEAHGLSAVFGDSLRDVPVTSLKSTLGHCLGASGSVEAVAALLALEDGLVPATVGYERPDPGLPEMRIAPEPEETDAAGVLMLSESFGGRCAALVFQRSDG